MKLTCILCYLSYVRLRHVQQYESCARSRFCSFAIMPTSPPAGGSGFVLTVGRYELRHGSLIIGIPCPQCTYL